MFGFGNLRGVTPQVAAEVRQRLYRLVFPVRDERAVGPADHDAEPDVSDRPAPGVVEPAAPRLRRVHLVVVAVLLVLALLAAMVLVVRRTPAPEPLPAPSPATTAGTATPSGQARSDDSRAGAALGSETGPTDSATAGASAGGRISVHVDGKVREPGVVRLPAGSRVVDAIEAAGGAKSGADLGTVNLARLVQDGEQVLVDTDQPPANAAASGGGLATPEGGSSAAPIDLNTATLPELEQLPGIGPALGQRILDFRAERGGFTAVEELHDVSGIGEQRFAELKDRVVVP